MPKSKAVKQQWLDRIEGLADEPALAMVNYKGLSAEEIELLRKGVREAGSRLAVVKNTLLARALAKRGVTLPDEVIKAPIAMAAHQDEVTLAKLIATFSAKHPAMAIHGMVVNAAFTDSQSVMALSRLPSREQLLGKVVGSLAAPLNGMMSVLTGNLRGLVSVLDQYQKGKS